MLLKKWIKENDHLANKDEHDIVSETELERLSQLQTPNEVIAVLHQFETNEPVVKKRAGSLS